MNWDWLPPAAIVSAVLIAGTTVWRLLDERSAMRHFERLVEATKSLQVDSEEHALIRRALVLLAYRLHRREEPKSFAWLWLLAVGAVIVSLVIAGFIWPQAFVLLTDSSVNENWQFVITATLSVAAASLGVALSAWRASRSRMLAEEIQLRETENLTRDRAERLNAVLRTHLEHRPSEKGDAKNADDV